MSATLPIRADGEHFVILQDNEKPNEDAADEGIVIIQNWFEEFRSRSKWSIFVV